MPPRDRGETTVKEAAENVIAALETMMANHHHLPVCGWRWFKCDDCGSTWKETTRDITSPSKVDCPNGCEQADTHVWQTERADLPRDQNGNLLKHEVEVLTKGLGFKKKR